MSPGVFAGVQVHRNGCIRFRIGNGIDIITRRTPADQGVRALATFQPVVTVPGDQGVRAGAAVQPVITVPAIQGIRAILAVQPVIAPAAAQGVRASATIQRVRSIIAFNDVIGVISG